MKSKSDKTACPVCDAQVSANAKFCPECGEQLLDSAPGRAWIAAMQEQIRQYRQNDLSFNICAGIGALIAVALPFIMRYVFTYTMDTLSWLLTGAGLVLFVVGVAGLWWDDNRVRKAIAVMKLGPEADEDLDEVEPRVEPEERNGEGKGEDEGQDEEDEE